MQTSDYCREIERYLCRKNDGHLIRVVGPSFDLVSGWAAQGVPLKVAFRGIDRCFERYYRKGPRRRPVKIDFCEADVLDAFDEWRRAVGLPAGDGSAGDQPQDEDHGGHSRESLTAHLERAVMRLSTARAAGTLGAEFDPVIDAVAHELDLARASGRGVRGEARRALVDRLSALDAGIVQTARDTLDSAAIDRLNVEAEEELSAFRERMVPDAFARARALAFVRLLRERLGLPIVSFT